MEEDYKAFNMSDVFRGYVIEERQDGWFFLDTDKLVAETWAERPCGSCGQRNTRDGHDACLGELPGVVNACCGHGSEAEAYLQFENGLIIRGAEAQAYLTSGAVETTHSK